MKNLLATAITITVAAMLTLLIAVPAIACSYEGAYCYESLGQCVEDSGGHKLFILTPRPRESDRSSACIRAPAMAQSIERSTGAKNDFKREQPCPSTGRSSGACPGYVIDHVIPLKMGGADDKSNMQWQTIEDAKAKDKIECGGRSCSVR